jgi:hypothetical protein
MSVLRTDRDRFFDNVGVVVDDLRPGTRVIVPVGTVNAAVNGGSSLAALAVCRGQVDREGWWWFDVYMIPGGDPLPQMYPASQLLGLAADGLTMPGLDPAEAVQPA